MVDCGPRDAEAMTASKPVIIVEVFALGAASMGKGVKLREYRSVESVDAVMQIESEMVRVKVHRKLPRGTGPRRRSKSSMSIFLSPRSLRPLH
jgi:hypothetical protein